MNGNWCDPKYVKVLVTAENIEEIAAAISPLDQRGEIEISQIMSAWDWAEDGEGGHTCVFHNSNRAAICTGGNSSWGDWDDSAMEISIDGGGTVGYDGAGMFDDDDE